MKTSDFLFMISVLIGGPLIVFLVLIPLDTPEKRIGGIVWFCGALVPLIGGIVATYLEMKKR